MSSTYDWRATANRRGAWASKRSTTRALLIAVAVLLITVIILAVITFVRAGRGDDTAAVRRLAERITDAGVVDVAGTITIDGSALSYSGSTEPGRIIAITLNTPGAGSLRVVDDGASVFIEGAPATWPALNITGGEGYTGWVKAASGDVFDRSILPDLTAVEALADYDGDVDMRGDTVLLPDSTVSAMADGDTLILTDGPIVWRLESTPNGQDYQDVASAIDSSAGQAGSLQPTGTGLRLAVPQPPAPAPVPGGELPAAGDEPPNPAPGHDRAANEGDQS